MHTLKRPKQSLSTRPHEHSKLTSPHNHPKPSDKHNNSDRKQLKKMHKKELNKGQTRLHELSSKHSLFQSLQELPVVKLGKQKHRRIRKKEDKNFAIQQKNEDSTASRDFRQYFKNYDHPNGEYFGSKVTSLDNKKASTRSRHSKKKQLNSDKASHSLEKCIKEYRRLSSQHKSQSQSLKSEVSDQQLRRLQKMQSIEKMRVMEDIVELEERRLRLKKVKSDFRR